MNFTTNSGGGVGYVEVPVLGRHWGRSCGQTATMTRSGIAGAVLKDGNVGLGHTLPASHERVGITFDEQGCGLSMEASTTMIFSCLGNIRLASSAVVTLAKESCQLALDDASSDFIRYLGGGLHCLIKGGRGSSSFKTGEQNFVELSMRIPRVHRRAGSSISM